MEKERYYNLVKSYIDLISTYLNKKPVVDTPIDDKTLSFFLKLSKRHSLTALFSKVAEYNKLQISDEIKAYLEESYLSALRKSVVFEKERKDLYKYLNDNQIDFLPLKGILLKDYYLDPYTREFADNDILFKDKDKVIKEFFTKRGYKVEQFRRACHDVYLKKPFYNFEMHRELFQIREDTKEYVDYFKGYINRSLVKQEHEHYLTNEDFYIYFIAHTHKHYSISGCGIRTLIDIYLYLKKNSLDFDYIDKELAKLSLLDFSNMIKDLCFKLFDNQNLNQKDIDNLIFIASSGTYGTLNNAVKKGVKEKGRFRYFMSRVFPPMSYYKDAAPIAYKTKILIPFAWLARVFRILFKNPKKAKDELKLIRKSKKKKK